MYCTSSSIYYLYSSPLSPIFSHLELIIFLFNLIKHSNSDDGLFAIRQIIEMRREFRKDVAFSFVDLEKTFDTVPRELTFAVMNGWRLERQRSEWLTRQQQ